MYARVFINHMERYPMNDTTPHSGEQSECPSTVQPSFTSVPLSGPDFEGARHYAIDRLTHSLPPERHFHSVARTTDEVLPAIEACAAAEDVRDGGLAMLRTAALFQHIGLTEQAGKRESSSAAIAQTVLPRYGFSSQQARFVATIIETAVPGQRSTLPLAQLLTDANHALFGSPQFLARSFDLRKELAAYGTAADDFAWYSNLLSCLREHRFWRPATEYRFAAQKQRNIATISYLLHQG